MSTTDLISTLEAHASSLDKMVQEVTETLNESKTVLERLHALDTQLKELERQEEIGHSAWWKEDFYEFFVSVCTTNRYMSMVRTSNGTKYRTLYDIRVKLDFIPEKGRTQETIVYELKTVPLSDIFQLDKTYVHMDKPVEVEVGHSCVMYSQSISQWGYTAQPTEWFMGFIYNEAQKLKKIALNQNKL